jgi:hypothetical protein
MAQVKVGMARAPFTSCGARDGWSVHDELTAGVVWIDDGRAPAALVALDHGEMSGRDTDAVKAEITKRTGLAPERLVVACSHTHSGLAPDLMKLGALIGELLLKARAAAEPAWLALVRNADNRRFSVNRRVKAGPLGTFTITYQRGTRASVENSTVDARGQIEDFIRYGVHLYAPNYADQGVAPRTVPMSEAAEACLAAVPPELFLDGPVDPHLEAVCFQRRNGSAIGTLVRAASHPVIFRGTRTKQFSADFPGVLCREVARVTNAPAIFFNGPCGNVKPIVINYGEAETERYGLALARNILAALPGQPSRPLERLTWLRVQEPFATAPDIRNVTAQDFEEVEAAFRRMAAASFDPSDLKQELDLLMRAWSGRYYQEQRETIRLPFTLCGLNDTPLCFLPGEIFVEISLAVKEQFPDRQIVIAELADSSDPGYVPVRAAFPGGGYEPNCTTLPEGAGEKMVDIVSKMLRLFYHLQAQGAGSGIKTGKTKVKVKKQKVKSRGPKKKKQGRRVKAQKGKRKIKKARPVRRPRSGKKVKGKKRSRK